jgi:precorrin-4 methylase
MNNQESISAKDKDKVKRTAAFVVGKLASGKSVKATDLFETDENGKLKAGTAGKIEKTSVFGKRG